MKISILLPIYKVMESQAVISLVPMLLEMIKKGHKLDILFNNSANIAVARNALVKLSLERMPDSDYIFWIDSDHVYSYDSFMALVKKIEESNIDMLSAAYKTRTSDNLAHVKDLQSKRQGSYKLTPDMHGIQEVLAVGFGFVVFRRQMIEDLYKKLNGVLFNMDPYGETGEDVYFCMRAADAGYKIYFDADTQIGHLATVVNK